jgi:hypothetical protein
LTAIAAGNLEIPICTVRWKDNIAAYRYPHALNDATHSLHRENARARASAPGMPRGG